MAEKIPSRDEAPRYVDYLEQHRWRWIMDERQQKEIIFAEVYARDFAHGTTGHNQLMLIAEMARLLDFVTKNYVPKADSATAALAPQHDDAPEKNWTTLSDERSMRPIGDGVFWLVFRKSDGSWYWAVIVNDQPSSSEFGPHTSRLSAIYDCETAHR